MGEVRTGAQGHACDILGVGQVCSCSGIMVTCAGCVVIMMGAVMCPQQPKCTTCLGGPGYEAGVYKA